MSLEEVYSQVPEVNCKGLCQAACGPIDCSDIELQTMADNGILPPNTVDHPTLGPLTCSHLNKDGKCSIYEHRPLICRLFGAVKRLQCPHGCRPKEFLSDQKAHELLNKLDNLTIS